MRLSPNVVLVLCTMFLMLTSAGMMSFALFLPFIEAEFPQLAARNRHGRQRRDCTVE